MKYYEISFPGEYGQHVVELWSEKQILKCYYPYWCSMMVKNVAAPDLNPKTCIDDWCVSHWAIEVEKPDWITEEPTEEFCDKVTELFSDKGYKSADLSEAIEFANKRNASLENFKLSRSTSEEKFSNP
jgi:hypothetical protein